MGLGIGVTAGAFSDQRTEAEKAADDINELTNKIYKLEEGTRSLREITSSFESIDNQILKTNKDLEEMESLLSKVPDTLSDEETITQDKTFLGIKTGTKEVEADFGYGVGVSEKEYYEAAITEQDKIDRLNEIIKNREKQSAE